MFSREYCEVFKNNFVLEQLWWLLLYKKCNERVKWTLSGGRNAHTNAAIVTLHTQMQLRLHCTKNEFPTKDFFSKCDQIHSFLRIWSSLMENFILKNTCVAWASGRGGSGNWSPPVPPEVTFLCWSLFLIKLQNWGLQLY